MKAPSLMSIREIKHDIFENFPEAVPLISSIKQKIELQTLLTDLRFANRTSSYSVNNTRRQQQQQQQDAMDIQQQPIRNRTKYSLDQDAMDIQQSYQQKLARQMRQRQYIQQRNRRARAREERAEALKREEQRLARQARQRERAEAARKEEQRLARQARQRERAEAARKEEQRLARQESQRLAKAAREERQRKMRQQASRRNTTSSTSSTTTSTKTKSKNPRITQQRIRQIEKIIPGNFKLGARTIQQLKDRDLKDKASELTAKMKDVYIRKRPEIKVPTTTLLHAVNAEIVKRGL